MKHKIKKAILYLHGFNSSPVASNKVNDLKSAFPETIVIAPRLPYDPFKSIFTAMNIIRQHDEVHVVGTSLGGFYAMVIHHLMEYHDDLYFYAINPVLKPAESFQKRIGQVFENYGDGEMFPVTEDYVNDLRFLTSILYDSEKPKYYGIDFFLGMQDDVVDPSATQQYLLSLGLPVRIYTDNQDHRFQDISLVIKQIRENFVFYCPFFG